MSTQQTAEISFWRGEFAKYPSREAYIAQRKSELQSQYLPELLKESGMGLDLACGLVSTMEELHHRKEYPGDGPLIVAADALMEHYQAICPMPNRDWILYEKADGENLQYASDRFDFVCCFNAIDHTPHPICMLDQIHRVLVPGGRLYFSVNFDPRIYAPHHSLWDMRMVEDRLASFKLLRGTLEWSVPWKKYIWTALYQKEAQ